VGLNGRPQWRNNTTFFYYPHPNHEISVLARTIAENAKRIPTRGNYPTYTELDLRYNWNVESWNGRLTFGVRNLLGSLPPFDDSNPFDADINFRLYDERGRSAYLGYRQVF
jgi:outer membrane receptor protein involved in Fe transport